MYFDIKKKCLGNYKCMRKKKFKEENKLLLPLCAFELSLNLLVLYTKVAFFTQ